MNLLAAFGWDPSSLSQLITNLLMVLGGFVAGYVLGIFAGSGFDKLVIHRTSPYALHRALRYLFGILVALIVAWIVFGGGGGSGDGDGRGEGSGQGDKKSNSKGSQTTSQTVSTIQTPTTDSKVSQTEVIRVTILGGDEVKEERFYLFDTEIQAVNFDTIRQKILDAKMKQRINPSLEIRLSAKPLASDHFAIKQLEAWAKNEAGLNVTFPRLGS